MRRSAATNVQVCILPETYGRPGNTGNVGRSYTFHNAKRCPITSPREKGKCHFAHLRTHQQHFNCCEVIKVAPYNPTPRLCYNGRTPGHKPQGGGILKPQIAERNQHLGTHRGCAVVSTTPHTKTLRGSGKVMSAPGRPSNGI